MNSQNVPGSGGRDFDTTMYWPSGVHAGDTMICGPIVGASVLADRARIRAVGVGDPQVLDAGAIGQERDRLAVGRPGRLALERQPAHDARRLPPPIGSV